MNNNKKILYNTLIAILGVLIISIIAVIIVGYFDFASTQTVANVINKEQNNKDKVTVILNTTQNELAKEEKNVEEEKQNDKEVEAKNEQNKETSKKEEKKKDPTANLKKYYIKVNYGAQVVNIYTYDKNGKYTVPVKAFVCSTGTETPRSGIYKIPAKITWCKMFGDVYAHYCSQIVGNILFHSVPYLQKSNDTLEYWAYDQLGTKASMGCIRLTTRDAKWIYDNVSIGTCVEFYSSSNPGPLGKPKAQKISNAPGNLKWWDPTDPDPKNPWHDYKPEKEENKNQNSQVANETSKNELQNQESVKNEENQIENSEQNTEVEENIEINGNEELKNNETDNSNNEEGKNNAIDNSLEQNNEVVNQNNETLNNTQVQNNERIEE